MPLYEYACEACGKRFERIQKFSDPLVSICPDCGGHVQKLISSPAFHLKGSGWYATDYAKKSADSGAAGSPKDSNDSKEAKDAPASKESKETSKDSAKDSPSTSSEPSKDKPAAPSESSGKK